MKSIYQILGMLLLLSVVLTGCSDKASLHNYIVKNAEETGFSSISIPKSIFEQKSVQLTEAEQEAYEAIQRINVFLFDKSKKAAQYDTELETVKTILKQPKYEELMNFGRSGMIKFSGEEESMDEIVIFLNDTERGFAIIRINGDDMTSEKFMRLYTMVTKNGFSTEDLDLGALGGFFGDEK